MTAGFHRGVFYWLLLLLPTLAVGTGALWLLQREQVRLDEQARLAAESRRGVIEARARLIAENVELLVGDVQAALMETLREVPADNPDAFLTEWEKTNPLVESTFRLGADNRILRPAASSPQSAAARWIGAWVAAGVPWDNSAKKQQSETDGLQQQQQLARKDIGYNVSSFQNARSELQDVARQKNRYEKTAAPVPAEMTGWQPWVEEGRVHLIGWRRPAVGGLVGVEVKLATVVERLGDFLPQEEEFTQAFALRNAESVWMRSKRYSGSAAVPSIGRVSRGGERTAWEGGLAGIFGQGNRTDENSLVKVPISSDVLPGWEVVGVVDFGAFSSGRSFFWTGAMLVFGAVGAILAAGSLLLRQTRRSEAEAAQKTSFVANVSHEFKTPLTTIRLYAELLEQGRVRDAAQGGDYLRTIGRETQRLARLVNNALDFSRLEQGKKKYARDAVDLTAEINRLLDTHAPRVAEAGLALNRELPSEPLPATTDRDAVEQIIINLLDNACKYAADGGEILVTLSRRASGGAEVRVADRGPGVPLEHRERIFEKFHRVDDALTAEKSGAGLGLSIARQLARGLGGELRYAARAGAGAEFILELP